MMNQMSMYFIYFNLLFFVLGEILLVFTDKKIKIKKLIRHCIFVRNTKQRNITTTATKYNIKRLEFAFTLFIDFLFLSFFSSNSSTKQFQRFIVALGRVISIKSLPEFIGRCRQCPQKSTLIVQGKQNFHATKNTHLYTHTAS